MNQAAIRSSVFEDDGLTGTDDTRENFMRMIGAIERGEGNCGRRENAFPGVSKLF